MTRVLIAPDSFKGSLAAADVAAHLAAGFRAARPEIVADELPVADGGEGTVAAALAAGFTEVAVTATGPLGDPVRTRYAVRGDTAVIEMAAVSGLEMVDPTSDTGRRATSRGVGELIRHVRERGAGTVVVGVGGSASTDGGAGMLAALGASLRDRSGAPLPDGGAALADLAAVDLSALESLRDLELVLASDVDNPLVGSRGAAVVYGPQKGLSEADVPELDAALARWRDVLAVAVDGAASAETGAEVALAERPGTVGNGVAVLADQPGAGAAGGVGFGLMVLGARRRPGIEMVLELAEFNRRAAGADLVVTGEGSLDAQSLNGKAPVGVATAAAALGIPTVAACGRRQIDADVAAAAGISGVHALTDVEPDPAVCMAEPGRLLVELGRRIADRHLPS